MALKHAFRAWETLGEVWPIIGPWGEVVTELERPLWLHLSPQARLRVLIALFSIVALGLLLLLFVRTFGRWVRYYSKAFDEEGRAGPSATPLRPDDWAERPLSGGSEPDEP